MGRACLPARFSRAFSCPACKPRCETSGLAPRSVSRRPPLNKRRRSKMLISAPSFSRFARRFGGPASIKRPPVYPPSARISVRGTRRPLRTAGPVLWDIHRSLAGHDQTSESIPDSESRMSPVGQSSHVCKVVATFRWTSRGRRQELNSGITARWDCAPGTSGFCVS